MDAVEQIKEFVRFLEGSYKPKLLEAIRNGHNFLVIDFAELSEFSPKLAETLIDEPEAVIEAAEEAVKEIVEIKTKRFNVRLKSLPTAQSMLIRNIRSVHLNKLLMFKGVVRQKSDVRPKVTSAKFECPNCSNIINVLQLDSNSLKEPSRCGCGRKGKFKPLEKTMVDAQNLVLEEDPEDLDGGEQPKRINVFLKDDLVSPLSERKTNPGSKVIVVGVIKEVPIILRTGATSTVFELLVEANYLDAVEEDFYELVVNDEEEKEILELAKDPHIMRRLVDSLAPSIYGYDKVKEALILQLLGGVRKERTDGVTTRGDMHILLIGDPGSGKSQLLKRIYKVAPKGRYVSGKGVTGAGLTAAVVKDEFLKGWSLEAGALVLANKGICCIDEMDKMSEDDRSAMHEAMEQQTISISKANIQATLISKTTVLAAANPKFGRFNYYETLAEQIDMPPALINRFDLMFPIKDIPDRTKDEKLASHVLNLHKAPDIEEADIHTEKLRKYIAYSRQKCNPVITDEALEEIKNYYVDMRNRENSEDRAARAIPISARQLEALVRLSEASAKARLSNKVTKNDAKKAIELLNHCLHEVGVDPETGKIDIDRITTGFSASQRNKIMVIKEIIEELENKIGKTIPIDDVVKAAADKGTPRGEAEEIIEKLRRSGDLFEPKRGFISRI